MPAAEIHTGEDDDSLLIREKTSKRHNFSCFISNVDSGDGRNILAGRNVPLCYVHARCTRLTVEGRKRPCFRCVLGYQTLFAHGHFLVVELLTSLAVRMEDSTGSSMYRVQRP